MPIKDSKRKLRIAFLTYRGKPYCGGQGVYTAHLTRQLSEMGHYVEVFSGQPYPEIEKGITLNKLPSLDIFNSQHPGRLPGFWEIKSLASAMETGASLLGTFGEPLAFSMRALKELKGRLDDFDLVHDNQSLGYGLLALQKKGLPVIATVHHPITVDRHLEMEYAKNFAERFSKSRWYAFTKMQTNVARRLPKIITVTDVTRKNIHVSHRVPLQNISVVPVGVDLNLFRPLPKIQRQPGHLITTASADVPLKGLIYLLEAIAKLGTEREVHLTVIGQLSKNSPAAAAIKKFGLQSRVTFVSGISDEELVETYARSSIAVVPSLYEGFSLPAIEAMAAGIPLIATRGGGLAEVAGPSDPDKAGAGESRAGNNKADDNAAFLIEPGDSGALCLAISELMDNPKLCEKLGKQGRKRVQERWSWENTAQKTLEEYRLLLAAQGK